MLKLLRVASILLLCTPQIFAQSLQGSKVSVSGRVTLNGRALPDVTVVAWRQPSNSPYSQTSAVAKTDSEGRYQLKLAEGSYYASVNAPGFYEVENGQFSRALRSITVNRDEVPTDFNFELRRGGVITGKVTTVDGQPLIEASVVLISADPATPRVMSERLELPDNAQTDDRGVYRIFGAIPGRYVIAVGSEVTAYNGSGGRPLYSRTFFPGTSDQTKATILTVTSGLELKGIDLKLAPPEKGYSVSARIVDEATERPIGNIDCSLSIIVNGDVRGTVHRNRSNQNGVCTIENIPAGTYRITVPGAGMIGTATSPNYYAQSSDFDVIDQDVTDILLKAKRASSISGVVVLEGQPDKRIRELFPKQNFIATIMPDPPGLISTKWFLLNDDGSFFVEGLQPGKLSLGVIPIQGVPRTFVLLRTEVHGVETKDAIVVKSGERISDLRVVYAYATGSIRGTVKSTNSSLPTDLKGTALLYRDAKPVAWAIVDSHGKFLIEAVPAGSYKLVVSITSDNPQKVTARSEQTVEVVDEKPTDVITLIEPNISP